MFAWERLIVRGSSPVRHWRWRSVKQMSHLSFFHKLHVPFYCFHDVDVSPEGASLKEYINNFAQMVDVPAGKQEESGVKLLWELLTALQTSLWRGCGDEPRS